MIGPQGSGIGSTVSKKDEAITVTSSYTNVFNFDIGTYSDGVLVLWADTLTNYRIYASAKDGTSAPIDGDDSWVNILDTNSTPSKYDSTTSKALPANTTFYESVSNKWRWFRIDMQTATTSNVKIWFRGRNII